MTDVLLVLVVPQTYPERDEDFFAADRHSDRLSILNTYKHKERQLRCRNKFNNKFEIIRTAVEILV